MGSEARYLPRRPQFALELIDPFTGERVHAGITATALDADEREIERRPVVNASGQFVWILPLRMPPLPPAQAPTVALPWAIRIDSGKTPFQPATIVLPDPLPASLLVSRPLQPSRAYPAPAGVTAVSGVLRETIDGALKPVSDAILRLTFDDDPDPVGAIRLGDGASDEDGEFIVATHARVPASAAIGGGRPQGRLLVARAGAQRWVDCAVTAGRLRPLAAPLDWTQLQPRN